MYQVKFDFCEDKFFAKLENICKYMSELDVQYVKLNVQMVDAGPQPGLTVVLSGLVEAGA